MGLGILGRSLGDVASAAALDAKYPWHVASKDTLALQTATNQSLQAAGYCPVPLTGILDGATCGARNHLTVHSREFFGQDMLFQNPPSCEDPAHANDLVTPTAGCFKPTPLQPGQKIGTVLTKQDWILIGGAASVVLAAVLMLNYGASRA